MGQGIGMTRRRGLALQLSAEPPLLTLLLTPLTPLLERDPVPQAGLHGRRGPELRWSGSGSGPATSTMRNTLRPPGVCTSTRSPRLRPRSALPTGDSMEMRPRAASDCDGATSVCSSSPQASRTRTVEPTPTSRTSISLPIVPTAMNASFRLSITGRFIGSDPSTMTSRK